MLQGWGSAAAAPTDPLVVKEPSTGWKAAQIYWGSTAPSIHCPCAGTPVLLTNQFEGSVVCNKTLSPKEGCGRQEMPCLCNF